jgi:hypothetical protein
MLQAGRSRDRPNPSSYGVVSAPYENEYQEFSWGRGKEGLPACKADLTVICNCLEKVGGSTSHNTMGLHGLLQGYTRIYPLHITLLPGKEPR